MVRSARKLQKEKGLFELPEGKRGRRLPKETEELVKSFYCDDQYSRMMLGRKDCVSISRNVHAQKRLLLCDVKELYAAFKKSHVC